MVIAFNIGLHFCDWFYPVKTSIRSKSGKLFKVWYRNLFEQSGAASFLLVQHILAKSAKEIFVFLVRQIIPANEKLF